MVSAEQRPSANQGHPYLTQISSIASPLRSFGVAPTKSHNGADRPARGLNRGGNQRKMKLPGLKSRVSFGLPGFAGLPTLRSGRHSSPGLKAWGFLAGFINRDRLINRMVLTE